MGKQSYASFGPDRGEKNNRLKDLSFATGWLFCFAMASFWVPYTHADNEKPVAASSPSVSSDQSQLLSLPAFDLDLAKDPVDKQSFRVGDQLELKVTGIQLPDIKQASKELTLDTSSIDQNIEEQAWSVEAKPTDLQVPANEFPFFAVPLKPGKLILPSMMLKNTAGKPVARTNPFSITVASAIHPKDPKPQEPADLEPPVQLVFPWWILILVGILSLGLVAGIIYGLYRWNKSRRPAVSKSAEVIRPEDETALMRLAELERQELLKKGNFKAHYFKVSEILKSYVGARYQFDAPESTTKEIIGILEDKKIASDAIIDKLEVVFERLDRVKFTDHIPIEQESSKLVDDAREFIMTTRRIPMSSQQTGASLNASR